MARLHGGSSCCHSSPQWTTIIPCILIARIPAIHDPWLALLSPQTLYLLVFPVRYPYIKKRKFHSHSETRMFHGNPAMYSHGHIRYYRQKSDSESDNDKAEKRKNRKAKKAKIMASNDSDTEDEGTKKDKKPVSSGSDTEDGKTKKNKTKYQTKPPKQQDKVKSDTDQGQKNKHKDKTPFYEDSDDECTQLVLAKPKTKSSHNEGQDAYPQSAKESKRMDRKTRQVVNSGFAGVGHLFTLVGSTLDKLCKQAGITNDVPDLTGNQAMFTIPVGGAQASLPAPPAYKAKTDEGQDEYNAVYGEVMNHGGTDAYAALVASDRAAKKDDEVVAQKAAHDAARAAKKAARKAMEKAQDEWNKIDSFNKTVSPPIILGWAKALGVVTPGVKRVPPVMLKIFDENHQVFGLVCYMIENNINPFLPLTKDESLKFDIYKHNFGFPVGQDWDGTFP